MNVTRRRGMVTSPYRHGSLLSFAVLLLVVPAAVLVWIRVASRDAGRHLARSSRAKAPLTRLERILVIMAVLSGVGGTANELSSSQQPTVLEVLVAAGAGSGGAVASYYLLRSCWGGCRRLFRWVQAGT